MLSPITSRVAALRDRCYSSTGGGASKEHLELIAKLKVGPWGRQGPGRHLREQVRKEPSAAGRSAPHPQPTTHNPLPPTPQDEIRDKDKALTEALATLGQAENHIYGLQVVQATKAAQISRLEVRRAPRTSRLPIAPATAPAPCACSLHPPTGPPP
jgi:hypothetical protein